MHGAPYNAETGIWYLFYRTGVEGRGGREREEDRGSGRQRAKKREGRGEERGRETGRVVKSKGWEGERGRDKGRGMERAGKVE